MGDILPGMINNKEFKIYVENIPTGKKVSFKAWVTGFSDNFRSQWTGTPVYGRMDDLYTFQKTSRSISLAFDVVAGNAAEAIQNQTNLNQLTQFLYPVYSKPVAVNPASPRRNSQILEAAPLLKLRWNALAQNAESGGHLVGFLAGLIHSPNLEAGQFFTDKKLGKDIHYQQHSVQLEFTVLHTHLPGWFTSDGTLRFGGKKQIEQNYPHSTPSLAGADDLAKELLAMAEEYGFADTAPNAAEIREEAADQAAAAAYLNASISGEPAPGITDFEFDPGSGVTVPREIVAAGEEDVTG